jgi:hypothetical protein
VNAAGDLDAAHDRHLHAHKHNIIGGCAQGGNGFCAVAGDCGAGAQLLQKTQGELLADVLPLKHTTGADPDDPVRAGKADSPALASSWRSTSRSNLSVLRRPAIWRATPCKYSPLSVCNWRAARVPAARLMASTMIKVAPPKTTTCLTRRSKLLHARRQRICCSPASRALINA